MHKYEAKAFPKTVFKTINPFTSIERDIDEDALAHFDKLLIDNGKFNVYQTYFTDKQSGERMVKSNAVNHEGELVDYIAYVTWNNTIHCRFESILKKCDIKFRNPFIPPHAYDAIRRELMDGLQPKPLNECNFEVQQGAVINLNAL